MAAESPGPHRLVERTAAAVAGTRDCHASAAPRRGSDFFEAGFQLKKGSDMPHPPLARDARASAGKLRRRASSREFPDGRQPRSRRNATPATADNGK